MTSERGFVRFPTTIESLISLFFINFVYKYYIYDILQYKYKSVKLFFVEMTDFFGRIELFHNNIQRVSYFSTQFPFIRSRRLSYLGKKKKKKNPGENVIPGNSKKRFDSGIFIRQEIIVRKRSLSIYCNPEKTDYRYSC